MNDTNTVEITVRVAAATAERYRAIERETGQPTAEVAARILDIHSQITTLMRAAQAVAKGKNP